ncbi:4-hydroxy-tetrahydrodipicolinate synthase [bacterium]|nr:4-hydroxy-tetrahydrodipicolinate synthase [candidate division CSSED10-310 bacterium]
MFQGSIVALVTPFKNNEIDLTALKKLIQFHVQNNTNGILIAGCTGEAANISDDELRIIIQTVKSELRDCARPIPLLAGTGTNTTSGTLKRTRIAEEEGVDGILLITPYYNKPTPEGQVEHFSRIAEQTELPIILYNVPGRTGINMLPDTIATLSKISNIVAVKEAGGSVDQVSAIRTLCDITILSGDDTLTLPMLSVGASGVISVTANIVPATVSRMCSAWHLGNTTEAMKLHLNLFHLTKMLFIETNPMPVKAALQMMGYITGDLRLPLVSVKPSSRDSIRKALIAANLIEERHE